MAIYTKNILIDQGANFDLEFILMQDEITPFDLTNWSAEMMVRRDYDKPPIASLTASTANGKIQINAVLGKVSLHYEPEDSSSPNIRFVGEELEGVYDMELTAPVAQGNRVIRLVGGTCTINKEVTRNG